MHSTFLSGTIDDPFDGPILDRMLVENTFIVWKASFLHFSSLMVPNNREVRFLQHGKKVHELASPFFRRRIRFQLVESPTSSQKNELCNIQECRYWNRTAQTSESCFIVPLSIFQTSPQSQLISKRENAIGCSRTVAAVIISRLEKRIPR
nr:hypothetical protein CFP56_11538 [Quercus suber]